MAHVKHMKRSRHTYESAMSHIRITHMNALVGKGFEIQSQTSRSGTIQRNTEVQKLSYYSLPQLVLVCTKLPKLSEQCRKPMVRMRRWQAPSGSESHAGCPVLIPCDSPLRFRLSQAGVPCTKAAANSRGLARLCNVFTSRILFVGII